MCVKSFVRSFSRFVIFIYLISGLLACGGESGGSNDALYTIGGTVTGLSGVVQLQDDTGNTLDVGSIGDFTFSTQMANGDTYNISISRQPETQSCTITNSTGTVLGDVSDISIDCVDLIDKGLVVSVSGLNSSIELRSNRGANLLIPADNEYIYTLNGTVGDSYQISIVSQPADQTCTLVNGNGVINLNNFSLGITIICGVPYDLGGSVSGLTGTVELQNDNGDILTLTTNGNFTFKEQVADGSSYNVRITKMPSDQRCEIINYRGRIRSNISDINVVCRTVYSLNGVITGLTGSLELINNGSVARTISSNGEFSLSSFVENTRYSIRISAEPADQRCSIENNSGILTQNISNINISCVNRSSFSIGGTVSGLIGTLVIQSNQSESLTLTNNDDFTFPTQIFQGKNYSVQISSQPNGQVCSINNAADIVGAVTVDTISIICGTPYTLSGSVSGLNGSLLLQNNGVNDLTVSQNGAFSFNSQIANGSTYNVSVASSSPGNQACSLSNASGIATGNVLDVQVICVDTVSRISGLGNGLPENAVIQGNYAYIAAIGGVLILDVSDPATPSLVVFYEFSGVRDLALNGNNLYTTHTNGMVVLDISAPASPIEIGRFEAVNNNPTSLELVGNNAYLLSEAGLNVIDISDPTQLSSLGYYAIRGGIEVHVNNTHAYVLSRSRNLKAINIVDPQNIVEVGSLDINAGSVVLSGNYIYGGSASAGLSVIDISNPETLNVVATNSTRADTITLVGDYAYLNSLTAVNILNISDPLNPVFVKEYRPPNLSWIRRLVANNNRLYVLPSGSVSDSVKIMNITLPESPVMEGSYNLAGGFLSYPRSGVVKNGFTYTVTWRDLTVVSLTDPVNPVHTETNMFSGRPYDVFVDAGYAYVAHSNAGLTILDLINPALPVEVGRIVLGGTSVTGVAVNANYAYVAGSNGFWIIDVSDKTQPIELSALTLENANPEKVVIAGNYAYVIDTTDKLRIIDVTDPTVPFEIPGTYFSNVQKTAIQNNFLYLISNQQLYIFDISADPTILNQTGLVSVPNAIDLAIDGNYAYVARRNLGFSVIDISDSAKPVEVATHPTLAYAASISVENAEVYIVETGYGLEVFEASLP